MQKYSKQSAFRRKGRGAVLVTAAVVSGCLLFPTAAQAATGTGGVALASDHTVTAAAPVITAIPSAPATPAPTPTPAPAAVKTPAATPTPAAISGQAPVPEKTSTSTSTSTSMIQATATTATTTTTGKTWPIYRSAYSPTIYELVNGTTPTPISTERWKSVYGSKTPLKTPTDYVRYAWSPTVYAQTYWPGGVQARQLDRLTTAQWQAAGSPAVRVVIGSIKGSTYHRWATSSQIFVKAPDGAVHALTDKEWKAAGDRPVETHSNQGFRRLAWANDIVRYTDIAAGRGYVINGATWAAEGFPRPQVLSSVPGELFHRTPYSPTIWYKGLNINRPISTEEWIRAGRPEPMVTYPIFADPLVPNIPLGTVDEFVPGVGTASVRGWVFDPDTTAPILADIYVDGKYAKTTRADRPRADLAAAYPQYGAAHGFSVDVPMSGGTHTVCAYGINVGPGSHAKLPCATVTVASPPIPRASTSTYARTANTFTNNTNAAIQWPFLKGVPLTDRFGPRPYVCSVCQPVHNGLDFTPGSGADIAAIAPGRVSAVVRSSATTGFGTYVIIDHSIDGKKVQSLYAHMLVDSPTVVVGDTVRQGDRVGRVGTTGSSTGAHLHFEVIVNGVKVDPYAWLVAHNR